PAPRPQSAGGGGPPPGGAPPRGGGGGAPPPPTGATVVAKFATTIIAGPGALYAQSGAPGWAGTAGSGDVLAGLTGTILAAHADALARDPGLTTLYAAAAVHVHARAAARAAGTTGGQVGHPITATDIARKLASTIGSMND
ncbi:NAD(P)H-hydrate dehydratase, partial [Trueperella bernardiae]|uniref:NAD(P)H-hydrate dehydratase n=1 Tax=Trueperella bernardiae TaxID=59561 RepID=UPI00294951D2